MKCIDGQHIFKDTKINTSPDLRTLADIFKNMGQSILPEQIYLECLSKLTPSDISYPYICISLSDMAEYTGDNDGFISWSRKANLSNHPNVVLVCENISLV